MRLARVVPIAVAAGALAVLVAVGSTSAATKQKAAGTPIVIGAAIDLTKNMAPFDAPALAAAKIEIAKINAAGGVDGHPLVLKYLNDQLDATQTKTDATKLISAGREHRLGHLRRRLRHPGDRRVPAGEAPDGRPVHRHGPDGAVALRLGREPGVHVRQRRPGRGRGDGGVGLRARLAFGRRRDRQAARVLPERLHRLQRPVPAARRQDRRLGVVHPGRQDDRQRRDPDQRQAGEHDRVLHLVRGRSAGVRRRAPLGGQQDADHEQLVR